MSAAPPLVDVMVIPSSPCNPASVNSVPSKVMISPYILLIVFAVMVTFLGVIVTEFLAAS